MKRLLLYVLLGVLFTACTTYKTQTTKTMDIYGAGVIQKPVIVDLEVNEARIEGTAIGAADGVSNESLKRAAVNDALEKVQADVLVEPKFKQITQNGKTTVTVSGFGAKYKNFHPIKAEEVDLLKAGRIQKAEVYETPAPKKKSSAGLIITIIIGLAVIIGLAAAGGA